MRNNTEAFVHKTRAGSLHECKDLCRSADICAGIEYSSKSSSCSIWQEVIETSFASFEQTCLAFHPHGFQALNGEAVDRACIGKSDPGGDRMDDGYSTLVGRTTEDQCRIACMQRQSCSGIEHKAIDGSCKLWTHAIVATKPAKGARCLRYEVRGFSKGPRGGIGVACRGDGPGDHDSNKHFTVNADSMYECKVACSWTDFCTGISYDRLDHRCDIWTHPINAAADALYSVCLHYHPGQSSSLLCATVMLPWTYEVDLIEMQLARKEGIVACDEFVVYSNPQQSLARGTVIARDLHMDLHCHKGGEYYTYINTPVFQKFWDRLIADGEFKSHAWIVKVDPDTVFFPNRLRQLLRGISETHSGGGLFLNNCQLGLHGPIEVTSRRALEIYRDHHYACPRPPQEDTYVQECFQHIGVSKRDVWDLLAERDCRRDGFVKDPEWHKCASRHAAFHPFKSVSAYLGCLANARSS